MGVSKFPQWARIESRQPVILRLKVVCVYRHVICERQVSSHRIWERVAYVYFRNVSDDPPMFFRQGVAGRDGGVNDRDFVDSGGANGPGRQ